MSLVIYDFELKNFRIEEFVPPSIFRKFGANSVRLLDINLLLTTQKMRDYFDASMTINNWHKPGGRFQNRAYRTPYSSVGATYSQHKMGRAIDFNVAGMTPTQVHRTIMDNQHDFLTMGVTTIEDLAFTSGWTHIDTRITNQKENILVVKP
jgi:uncharacterized protein YcbK (DUF882 family)